MARAQTFTASARVAARSASAVRAAPAPRLPAKHSPVPAVLSGALGAPHTDLLRPALRGSRTSLTCRCGEQAPRVGCTHAEKARFGGERFARAFLCPACGQRYVGRTRPGIDWLR